VNSKRTTEVVATSTDSHFSHLAWINMPRKVRACAHAAQALCFQQGGLVDMNIPVLTDFN
jgi:alkyl hydroperoxide reductase subunit AhpC